MGNELLAQLRSFSRRAVPRWLQALSALSLLALPFWLYRDWLKYYSLFGDDFLYIAGSRDMATLTENLAKPHNTHVVPVFRFITFLILQAAGPRTNWQTWFAAGAMIPVVLSMIAAGILVLRESGQMRFGLIAMAAVGLSSTLQPAVAWYSAGQALWAGAMVVVAIAFASVWADHEHGGTAWLIACILASVVAILLWSGGLAALPAVATYLWFRGGKRRRLAAILFAASLVIAAIAVVILSIDHIREQKPVLENKPDQNPRSIQAILSSGQAIIECMVLGNIGIDAETTPAQGLLLSSCLAGFWLHDSWRRRSIQPAAAAGFVVVLFSYLMVFFFRGNMTYASLRPIAWYNLVPHVGFVVWIICWLSGRYANHETSPNPLDFRSFAWVCIFVCVFVTAHLPRFQRQLIQAAPPMSPSEWLQLPIPPLQAQRSRVLIENHALRQFRALERLDRAESQAQSLGVGSADLKAALGPVYVIGQVQDPYHYSAIDLLRIPAQGRSIAREELLRTFAPSFRYERDWRPPWLVSTDKWPPEIEHSRWVGPE